MDPFARLLGASAAAQEIRDFGRRAAAVDATVLLTGESGTGKGLLARGIHEASARARRAFVGVNCAGVPETLFESEFFGHTRGAFTGAQHAHRGLFEQAHGGTLFLDEIGELPLGLQAKLLTVVEDGEVRRLGGERVLRVEARIVAATGVDLDAAVAARAFRRDLYHRLLVLSYRLPPLRERAGDVEFLAHHFVDRFSDRYARPITGFDRAALARIEAHPWPGNVRELAHAIEAAVLACDGGRICAHHLPLADRACALPQHWADPRGRYHVEGDPAEEAARIRDALARCGGNKTRAARLLGMSRNTLRAKLRPEP